MNPHHDAGAIRALDASEPYDVCIIGSGPAGTILGTSLVERGIRTLILESGTNLFRWLFDRRLRFLSRYEFTGNAGYPLTNTRARTLEGHPTSGPADARGFTFRILNPIPIHRMRIPGPSPMMSWIPITKEPSTLCGYGEAISQGMFPPGKVLCRFHRTRARTASSRISPTSG